jgi:hypothetical protein
MEPIVSAARLFVGTHSGMLHALQADSGEPLWTFRSHGAFLHSPAAGEQVVAAASTDGYLYGIAAESGRLLWRCFLGDGGVSAAPVIDGGVIFVGTRKGEVFAVALEQGTVLWHQPAGIPIRQTAAVAQGSVFVTGEDLRVRCLDASSGKERWRSAQFPGQTARDYYPVVITDKAGRTRVIVRTNPVLNMGQRIGRDRTMLCRGAGVDDSSWQKLEAWLKSDQARGNPELWAREQTAILEHLAQEPDARTFFVLDAETGKEAFPAPVLWIGGCQGVGLQPAATNDGRLLVFYRSAYGNWNHGVAPLVALGLLDLDSHRITPLFHQEGAQPRWNCFWGTADESQNFVVAGETVLIVHQGTLSGFNLKTSELFAIWGERDTFGGFGNPSWARNEWHGPARSGVAVVDNRIYWQTGSRILCLEAGRQGAGDAPKPVNAIESNAVQMAPPTPSVAASELQARLNRTAAEAMSRSWAPLFADPGLAGRVFAFQHSGEVFEALAWAFPHLTTELQKQAKALLRFEWNAHPPYSRAGTYRLDQGPRREWFKVRREYCERLGGDKQPHPFGNLAAIRLFAERCGEESSVLEAWPLLKASYGEFLRSNWRLESVKGDLFANRYLASLVAFKTFARKAGDPAAAEEAAAKIEQTRAALVAWWCQSSQRGALATFNTSTELDPVINQGDGIFFAVAPHRHAVALFRDLTPEVAGLVRRDAAEAIEKVWRTFLALCPTWHLIGEERQVHSGENFADPPEFALSAFRALAWLRPSLPQTLARHVDLPACRADLYYLTKLAVTLDAFGESKPPSGEPPWH